MALIQTSRQPDGVTSGVGATDDGLPLHRTEFRAMGTRCLLQYACADDAAGQRFVEAAQAWVHTFEARYTRFRDDSIVGRINLAAGNGEWIAVDAEMERMLEMCGMVHFMSRGIVDVTAGPLALLWDYHRSHSRLPTETEIATARALVGWDKVERKAGGIRLPQAGMSLDFGGWGKELAVDTVAQMAVAHGVPNALVDFGHDIRVIGTPPGRPAWHIGLEDPESDGALWGSIGVRDTAVASSGDYQRGFIFEGQNYGHILDPRTGRPACSALRQVTVVAPSCLQAGLLATSAFVLGPDEGLDLIQATMGAEGCMVSTQAKHQTRGFYEYVVT